MSSCHGSGKALWGAVMVVILGLAIAAALFSGCQRVEKLGKHWESGMDGLNRTITLYDIDGDVVGQWRTKTYVETTRGGIIAFFDSTGKEVKLAGGIVVVQEN